MSHPLIDDREDSIRCSACGMPNNPEVRSAGHEYIPNNSAIDGETNSNIDEDAGGCSFCGCPEWDAGGKITWGRQRRHMG